MANLTPLGGILFKYFGGVLFDYYLHFQWNKVYVIDTVQGALIKRVKKAADNDNILLVSENTNYDPFELPISQINAIAIVIGVIRLE